jgi:tetratricopeptide (TPR) repeat protein
MVSKASRWVLAGLLTAGAATAQIHDPRALEADPATAEGPIAPSLEGLGDYHLEVTTDSPESQAFFDQGLRLTYGFNHSEALRAYKEAARLDPENAMAYWGWAMALGPNLNLPMMPYVVEQAHRAASRAVELSDGASPKERALIQALAARYTDDPEADRAPFDEAYAEAMADVLERFPDDLDVATFYADALLNLSPWDYWYLDGLAKENTDEVLATLESVIERDPHHPGALHLYIHAVEARHPERAEVYADNLAALMPGAGHMVHMPSHIYMRVGRYGDSWEANRLAVEADESYITQCRAQGLYPLGYYPHNIHFMAWSAAFQGRREAAMEASRKIVERIPHELAADRNTWALYETFLSQPLYTMVRFGMWDEILAEPAPGIESHFMTGIWHYARALARLHGEGDVAAARQELAALVASRGEVDEQDAYSIGFGDVERLLTIAIEIVEGELDAAAGDYGAAAAHLERAVRLEDGLLYNEPPDWYFPVRHVLGAVLIEAGLPGEAEVVYWADLRRNPDNGYSLFGLKKALEAQGRVDDALAIAERFNRAWADADHQLTTSRF